MEQLWSEQEFKYSQTLQSPCRFRWYDNENNQYRYWYYTRLDQWIRLYDAIISRNDLEWWFTAFYIHERDTINMIIPFTDKEWKELYQWDTVSFINGMWIEEKAEITWYKIWCRWLWDCETTLQELLERNENQDEWKYLNVTFVSSPK
jgi:hypothetical protein